MSLLLCYHLRLQYYCTMYSVHIADNTALSDFFVFAINFSFVDETYYRWKHVGLYTIIALLPVQCTLYSTLHNLLQCLRKHFSHTVRKFN